MSRNVFHFTDSGAFGGAEQALLLLLRNLDRRRWRPVLVHHGSPGIEPLLAGARDAGVALWQVPEMPLGWTGALRAAWFAGRLRRARPAVFHAHLSWPLACKNGLAAAVAARVPAIIATEQLFVELTPTPATRLQQRLLARGVDRYLAVSRHTSARLGDVLGLPRDKVDVVANAAETGAFEGEADPDLRTELRGPDDRPVVLVVARLHAQKGHAYAIEAARATPGARFVFAGDGPERGALERASKAAGLADRVVFLGSRSDVPALLACADIVLLPSLYEGLPLSVVEAMAAGKPVVATRIGGTDEAVVHGETGLLVEPRDPGALAGAIEALLADPSRARTMGAAGRERARRLFSAERLVGDVIRIYDEVLGAAT